MVKGNSTLNDVKSYITLSLLNSPKIINSNISRLAYENQFTRIPISLEINNSKIYEFAIETFNNFKKLSAKNSTFFSVNISHNNDMTTDFGSNKISYLRLHGLSNSTGQATLKNNTILKLLISGSLDVDIHQNNLGIYKEGFYGIDKEPIWDLWWFDDFKSRNGPAVSLYTSSRFEIREFDLSNNYWAPDILEEMKEKGPGQNISFIYDYYDDLSLYKIIYKNWSKAEF